MALTVGTYLIDRYQPDLEDRIIDITNMNADRALIAHGKGPQMLRASVKAEWSAKKAEFSFYSVDVCDLLLLNCSS